MELLAELHFRRNEPERLEAVLAGIDLDELPEADRVRVVRRRSSNRFYAMTDADGALAVLDETAHHFGAPWAMQALAAAPGDDPLDGGLRRRRPLLHRAAARRRGPSAPVRGAPRCGPSALAAAGRGDEALVLVDEAPTSTTSFDRDLTRPGRSILLFNQIFSLTELGRLDEARAAGAAAAAGDLVGGRVIVARVRSTPRRAARRRRRGCARAERGVRARGPALVARSAPSAGCSRSSAWPGSSAETERAGAAISIESPSSGPTRATAVCSAAIVTGRSVGWRWSDRARAPRTRCSCAARDIAAQRGAYALEAMLRHDVVRFGGAAAVVDRLVELASSVQGPLAVARADHAAGVVAVDPARLRVGRRRVRAGRLAAARRRGGTRPRGRGGSDRRRSECDHGPRPRDAVGRPPRPTGGHASTHVGRAEQTVAGALEHRLGDQRVHAAPRCLGLGMSSASPTTAAMAAIRASPTKA